MKPEYLHLLTNHFPICGTAVGLIALGIGIITKSRRAQTGALLGLLFCSVLAIVTFRAGYTAYDRLSAVVDDDSQKWLDDHMERAEKVEWISWLVPVAVVAGIAAVGFSKNAALRFGMATLAGIICSASMGADMWVAYSGGRVRHPELREHEPDGSPLPSHTAATPPAAAPEAEEQEAAEKPHDADDAQEKTPESTASAAEPTTPSPSQ